MLPFLDACSFLPFSYIFTESVARSRTATKWTGPLTTLASST